MRDGWSKTRVGDLCVLEYGKALKESDRDNGRFPVYGSAGVVGSHSEHLGPDGPMIVVGRKGTAGAVHYSAQPAWPIDTAYWVRRRADSVGLKFLYLVLEDIDLPAICAQTGVPGLNRERAYELHVTVPPREAQVRMVDLVSGYDAAESAFRGASESAATAALAIRSQAFDDPSRAPVPLVSLCDADGIQIGPFGSQLHASDYVPSGVPTVMPKDIIDGRIEADSIARVGLTDWERLSKHHLREGDIVLPRRGDLNKRALVTADRAGWLCGTGSVRVRVANEDPGVVLEALSTAGVERWLADNAVGITMPNLNTKIVGRIPVRIPADGLAVVQLLRAVAEYRQACIEAAALVRLARSAALAELLSGNHEIPRSYDALLEQVS